MWGSYGCEPSTDSSRLSSSVASSLSAKQAGRLLTSLWMMANSGSQPLPMREQMIATSAPPLIRAS